MDYIGPSVEDVLYSRTRMRFARNDVQNFAQQLFRSVTFLHDLGLIHTDIKPANILVCDRASPSSGFQFRLIDFGSAIFRNEKHPPLVCTRYYRAPEVIIQLAWSFPCDIWSIGCTLVEVFTGHPYVYCADDVLEHLLMIEKICGKRIGTHLIKQGRRRMRRKEKIKILGVWQTPVVRKFFSYDDYQLRCPIKPNPTIDSVKALNQIIQSDSIFSDNFLDLLKMIFVCDPVQRISAKQALQHPWFKTAVDGKGVVRKVEFKSSSGALITPPPSVHTA